MTALAIELVVPTLDVGGMEVLVASMARGLTETPEQRARS